MKKKRLLSLVMAVSLLFGSAAALPESVVTDSTSITASAASTATSGKCGENVSWSLKNGVLTISGTGKITDFGFGSSPFYQRTDIKSVVIKSGITSIGYSTFAGCPSLTSVTIPSSVKSIGEWAFYGCGSLPKVNIPSSVTSIGNSAFYNCTSLTSVTIPSSVTSIGREAFDCCTSLTSITIPDNVTEIYYRTFYNCISLASINIPDGVTSIGDSAFSGCEFLTSVTIPSSVTSIGGSAFSSCKSLTSITIPDNVTEIYYSTFYNCISLASINIPDGVTSIGDSAFDNCTSLKSATIPSSVTSIGAYAFSSCKSLTSITIPSSVTSIGREAFDCCTSLTSIDVDSNNDIYSSVDGVLYNKDKTELIKCPEGKPSVTIPSSVTSIGREAFYKCSSLTSITIPECVTSIGLRAFSNCKSLASVTISGNITSVGYGAFERTKWLENKKEQNVLVIEKGILIDAQDYTGASITIPDSVTIIGGGAFSGCESLKNVVIPNSVLSIGDSAFYYCTYLTDITIPNSIASIGNSAFYRCTNLRSINIPNSVKSIGGGAFYDCWGISSVVIPSSVTNIGERAFGYINDNVYYYDEIPDSFKIYCSKDSAGEQYAKENGAMYEYIKELKLTKQPTNVTVAKAGDTASFSVTATGTDLKYEWYVKDPGGNWTKTGATSNKYSVSITAARNGRQVFCKVIDETGDFVKSNIVTAKYVEKFAITKQPTNITVAKAGDTASFSVTATGTGLKYEWYIKDIGGSWTKVGSTSNKYSVAIKEARNGRQVFCKVIDSTGTFVKSDIVTATIKGTVVITKQPTNVTVTKAGNTASFSVTALGSNLKYEWYIKDPKGSWTKTGATSNKYSVPVTAARNGRQVFCKVIDFKNRSVRSNIVTAKIK